MQQPLFGGWTFAVIVGEELSVIGGHDQFMAQYEREE